MSAPNLDGIGADLHDAALAIAARECVYGAPLVLLASTTSTNDDAKAAAKHGAPSGSVWVSESQSQGRGRQGRSWQSTPGENLMFSLLLRVHAAPADLPRATLACGLAVREACMRALGRQNVALKWPNDVLCGGKKLAGILVESMVRGSSVEALVIGIGLNVHARVFPEELQTRATSLALCMPDGDSRPLDRSVILADILTELARDVESAIAKGLGIMHARLSAADGLRGHRVERMPSGQGPASGIDSGTAEGIDLDGRLLVRDDTGILHRWPSGEVHLRKNDA